MKQARDYAEAGSISAYVILDENRALVGKAHTWFSSGDAGTVVVTLYDYSPDSEGPQTSSASGHGYDKEVSALSTMVFAGHELADHCGNSLDIPEEGWDRDATPPKGYRFANYRDGAYRSCFQQPGLSVLEDFGFTVIQAI